MQSFFSKIVIQSDRVVKEDLSPFQKRIQSFTDNFFAIKKRRSFDPATYSLSEAKGETSKLFKTSFISELFMVLVVGQVCFHFESAGCWSLHKDNKKLRYTDQTMVCSKVGIAKPLRKW